MIESSNKPEFVRFASNDLVVLHDLGLQVQCAMERMQKSITLSGKLVAAEQAGLAVNQAMNILTEVKDTWEKPQ